MAHDNDISHETRDMPAVQSGSWYRVFQFHAQEKKRDLHH